MEIVTVSLVAVAITTFLYLIFRDSSPKGLPPGPKPWPIVGNLLQLGEKPHSQFAQLAETYGDLFSLKLGSETVVIASTPLAASEILKTHDRVLSGRYVFQSFRVKEHVENSIVWSECNDTWKKLRKVCRTELFTQKMIESQADIRESKAMEMVKYLKKNEGNEVKIVEVVFGTLVNIFGNLIFSQNIFKLGDESSGSVEMKEHLWRMLELGNSTNPADYFPFLGRFDLFGQRKDVADCLQGIYSVWGAMLKERKIPKLHNNSKKNDFVEILLDSGLDDQQINALLMEIFGAGTETSASTIEWALSELTKNPDVTANMRSELLSVVGKRPVKESDIPNMPYLQAFVKETLRLHPATPLLLPRRALETCKVLNYIIPKECQIMVNAWGIGRDPKRWTDPLKFSPERFLNSSIDFKGNDFELIPFGAGRRICPGVPLATQFISLIVPTLVQNFDWGLPKGMDPSQLIMEEKFGLTLQKEPPLYIVPKTRD
ncbi:(S)-N-methylcoclaurine 3'-hydroxylase isozyme 1-like [Papaver somniferum]|uniref:(S)-N-methylcoclaurine 3'-hydroxylase isozyme 1-like n=1 Tax=Papaver somniferum TaxID=3469 RepID=UPI000E6FB895|nr:(S)-N-methylcoclaurine 3'-hydroxylase isozyme 1-like [Papaver somniferum]